jgi:hypothetical protein
MSEHEREPWPPVRNADDCERLLERLVMAGLDDAPALIVCDGVFVSYAHLMSRSDIVRYWGIRFGVRLPPNCLRLH